nr:hypothetical protein [Tanacetum cinerariifolium]
MPPSHGMSRGQGSQPVALSSRMPTAVQPQPPYWIMVVGLAPIRLEMCEPIRDAHVKTRRSIKNTAKKSGQGQGRGCGSYGGGCGSGCRDGSRGQGQASRPHSLGRGNNHDHQYRPSTTHALVQPQAPMHIPQTPMQYRTAQSMPPSKSRGWGASSSRVPTDAMINLSIGTSTPVASVLCRPCSHNPPVGLASIRQNV